MSSVDNNGVLTLGFSYAVEVDPVGYTFVTAHPDGTVRTIYCALNHVQLPSRYHSMHVFVRPRNKPDLGLFGASFAALIMARYQPRADRGGPLARFFQDQLML